MTFGWRRSDKSRRHETQRALYFEEQVELFQFASLMLGSECIDIDSILTETICKINKDLSPSACSIFYWDGSSANMVEKRVKDDVRKSKLRSFARASPCFGKPAADVTQHLVYLPNVSSSTEYRDFLPKDDNGKLYESVIYISIFDPGSHSKLPRASIEISSWQEDAFGIQAHLCIRTTTLIMGCAIQNINNNIYRRGAKLLHEMNNSIRYEPSKMCIDLERLITENFFEEIKCDGMCIFEADNKSNSL